MLRKLQGVTERVVYHYLIKFETYVVSCAFPNFICIMLFYFILQWPKNMLSLPFVIAENCESLSSVFKHPLPGSCPEVNSKLLFRGCKCNISKSNMVVNL